MELILGQYLYKDIQQNLLIELQARDRKTRTFFTIYGALHPKSDIDRLYIPKKKEEQV